MSLIKVAGIALPWFEAAETFHREKFSPLSFREFLRSPAASTVPVLFGHDSTMPVPIVGGIEWKNSDAGLAVEFSIDAETKFGRQIVLAIRHGHLRHLSAATPVIESEKRIDAAGRRYQRITSAEVRELSIVPEPAFRGTSIRISRQPMPTVKTYPADAADRATLKAFLLLAGIDSPAFLPKVESGLFQRPKPTPSASSSAKPSGDPLKPFRNADLSLAELSTIKVAGRTLYEHMSQQERQNAIDQLLDSEPKRKPR